MKFLIFGAGKALKGLLDSKEFFEHDLIGVIDNDKDKWGSTIKWKNKRIEITSVEQLCAMDFDRVYISTRSYEYISEIAMQLLHVGVPSSAIYYRSNNFWTQMPEIHQWASAFPANERIFFDTSQIAEQDIGTGIQRVVNNLFVHLRKYYGSRIVSFQKFMEFYITTRSYQCRLTDEKYDNTEYRFEPMPNDIILMADANWGTAVDILEKESRKQTQVAVVVYDLLPLNRDWFPDDLSKAFEKWILSVLKNANKVICISRTVADKVVEFFSIRKIQRDVPLQIFVCNHWGANIPATLCIPRKEIEEFVGRRKTFLMVGNVDIRKNQLLALQALREIVRNHPDKEIQILILGRKAYKYQDVVDFLEDNPFLADRVRWIIGATDGELQWAYKNATALLFLSKDEGYGLPLVEAANHGLPILCSDIPIFHEVAEVGATYVDIGSVEALTKSILDWLQQDDHPDSRNVPIYTWEQTAKEMVDILENGSVPYIVLP